MHGGEIFDWSIAEKIIDLTYKVLVKDGPIAYIGNRIHYHAVTPTDWFKIL